MGELRPRITYFSPFVPHSAIPHAGGQFLFHFLDRLSPSVDITLIAPFSPVNEAALGEVVPPVEIHLVPVRPRPRSLIGFLPRLLANTAAGVTPGWQVLRGFRSDRWVWERVRSSSLVELEWTWYVPFVADIRRRAPGVPVTAFEYDVLTESLTRRARAGSILERTLGRVAAARARRVEPALLNRCDAVFTFSARDRDLLVGMGVRSPIQVVDPPALTTGQVSPEERDAQTVLFVGDMSRPENHQGAEWLAREVWPEVSRACPQARLVIAGSNPPASLRHLAGDRVTVTGYVDDLEPHYRRAGVFAAPNLTGAGVKFKVLDALRHGLPVVATPIAAEGIADRPGSCGFAAITRDPSETAAALVGLLSAPAHAREIGAAGRDWVRAEFDFDRSVEEVLATYMRLISSGGSSRSPAAG